MAQATRRRRTPPLPTPESYDPPVVAGASLTVMTAMREYKREAQKAREPRLKQTKRNWDAFMGIQDWSKKIKGQSTEFLPLVAMAKEQIAAFIERGLTDFGDWFAPELANESIMSNSQARKLLQYYLDGAAKQAQNADEDFAALMADAITVALLGSLAILKVHGRDVTEHVFRAERGIQYLSLPDGSVLPQITNELVRKEVSSWKLVIDLVAPEDYLPDPTGRGLYEMHEVERDLWEVQQMADAGVYDPDIVSQIREDYAHMEEDAYRTYEQDRSRREQASPSFRYRVKLLECWGSILTPEGRLAEQNIVSTMANEKYLIRPPQANPYWHGERPFVTRPLIRVPFSTWHKALFDHATDLNLALNEIYNLILDGGIASVWGIKQVRPDMLEDPRQVREGIAQGDTLIVKEAAPSGVKAIELMASGQVPPDAMATFNVTLQQFETATQVNAVRLGQTPGQKTTATAVIEAQAQSNSFFDGMMKDAEKMITKVLHLSWSNMMQFLENVDAEEVVTAIGERAAMALAQLSPAERYQMLAGCKFKVSGLSAMVSRVRDFQKLMALMQAIGSIPFLMIPFSQHASGWKVIEQLFKSLNIDPSTLEPDPEEQAQQPQMMQQLMQMMGVEGGGVPQPGQGAEVPPEVPGNLPVERMPASGAGGY